MHRMFITLSSKKGLFGIPLFLVLLFLVQEINGFAYWNSSRNLNKMINNCLVEPPTNDNCSNATALTVNSNSICTTSTSGTTESATGTTLALCDNNSNADDDVWYKFVSTATSHNVTVTPNTLTNVVFEVFSGTCSGLTSIACVNNTGGANDETTTLTGLIIGTTYLVRVYSNGNSTKVGTFSICITTPVILVNDFCANAIAITVNQTSTCTSSTTGTTENATESSNGCNGTADDDAWFKFVATATSHIVTVTPTTLYDAVFQVFYGSCAGTTSIICVDDTFITDIETTTLTGLTIGNTYLVRVYSYSSGSGQGTFSICITTPAIPPPNTQDCLGAIKVCNNIYNQPNSYSGTGNVPNEINTSNSCLKTGERNDVWYTFSVVSSGNLNFTITPNQLADDYDWAIYNLTNANCSDIYSNSSLMVSCNYSATSGVTGTTSSGNETSQPSTGTPFNTIFTVTAGQTYVMNISNYSSTQYGYTLNFGNSTAIIYDTIAPSLQSLVQPVACGVSSLSFNFSEPILCSSINNSNFSLTGPGGTYSLSGITGLACNNGAGQEKDFTINVNPALTFAGNYTLNYNGNSQDLCGNFAVPHTINFTVTTGLTANAGVNQTICMDSTIQLTGSAIGGTAFTYSWSPTTGLSSSTISNPIATPSTTTTYTMTATANGCTVSDDVLVTVNQLITPTFTPIAAVCKGFTLPELPTTSSNSITGNWSPALNNTTTTTYTFTPNVGQCTTTTLTTLSITINPIPSTNPINHE